jgi:acetyl-CoA acetyltransferase
MMNQTADFVAAKYGITREAQDTYVGESQQSVTVCEGRSTLLELARRNKRRAVVGVCTAGGMATAAYLERA